MRRQCPVPAPARLGPGPPVSSELFVCCLLDRSTGGVGISLYILRSVDLVSYRNLADCTEFDLGVDHGVDHVLIIYGALSCRDRWPHDSMEDRAAIEDPTAALPRFNRLFDVVISQ